MAPGTGYKELWALVLLDAVDRKACNTIKPHLQTLTDNIIQAEKDKAMKEFRSTESLNLPGTEDTPEANKLAVIEHHTHCTVMGQKITVNCSG